MQRDTIIPRMTDEPQNKIPQSPSITDRKPRVLVVYPYSSNPNNSPPLGMAYIAAVFRDKGCEVQCIDAAARMVEADDDKVSAALKEFQPDVVALSVIVGNALFSYRLIREHLSLENWIIIAGGPHATILPEEVLNHGAHIVVRGEGEQTTGELVDWLQGGKQLDSIDGISYFEGGEHRHNPDRGFIKELDQLPFPAHELFDPEYYTDEPDRWIHFGKLISSRGCPNRCGFCANPIFGRKFRYRSSDSVIEEMDLLHERYGTDCFEFLDDAFTANRRRMLDLAEAIGKMPEFTFSCVTRLENLDGETVPALRAAGLYRAHIGVESARRETLRKIHKNIDLDKLEPTLKLLKKNGIESSLFFMFGFPWESADEMMETNEYIERLKALATYFSEGGVVAPYPGTEIYDEYHESVGFTEWWLNNWQPWDEPLHELQPYYFFDYDEAKKKIIRQALDFICEHNRENLVDKKQALNDLKEAKAEVSRLAYIISELEEQVRDRDRQLRDLWDRSPQERLKKLLKKVKGD